MANPATTNIPIGSPLARKVYGVALFHDAVRKGNFSRLLSGPAPSDGKVISKAKGKEQSSADYPIVRVTDLSKKAGDSVTVDVFNIIKGDPIMGDEKITGKLMGLSFSSDEMSINQVRGGVSVGGRMSQQRTERNLRSIAKANLAGWYARFDDQSIQVHLSGARGTHSSPEWVVPLETNADFAKIMVNPVKPPTYNRHMFANSKTAITALAAGDLLTLSDIDRIRTTLDELPFPMQAIKLAEDPGASENPLYMMLVTTRQWHDLITATGATAWRTFLSNARERAAKNPLFTGDAGMWNGILVRKTARPIRWVAGDDVNTYTAASPTTVVPQTVPAGVTVDRALVLGAQALATVYGRHQKSDYFFDWFERKVAEDHDNSMEVSIAAMNGKSKLTFDVEGVGTDHGVLAFDTAISAV